MNPYFPTTARGNVKCLPEYKYFDILFTTTMYKQTEKFVPYYKHMGLTRTLFSYAQESIVP
jgi:hypothetical protein